MTKCLRKEARELLAWCLEQRGPFTRSHAKICTNGVSRHLGRFRTAKEASDAYLEEKKKVHIGCGI